MTARTVHDLAGGVYVDAKRGPTDKLHATSWKPNEHGARHAACGLVGRFVPPFGHADFGAFPKLDDVTDTTPPPMREVPHGQRHRRRQGRRLMCDLGTGVQRQLARVLILDTDEYDALEQLLDGAGATPGNRGHGDWAVNRLARKVNDIR